MEICVVALQGQDRIHSTQRTFRARKHQHYENKDFFSNQKCNKIRIRPYMYMYINIQ